MGTFLLVCIGVLAWFSVTCLVIAFFKGASTPTPKPERSTGVPHEDVIRHFEGGGSIEQL